VRTAVIRKSLTHREEGESLERQLMLVTLFTLALVTHVHCACIFPSPGDQGSEEGN
jgi:hypothetical protein